jgi:hypothetical protein
MDKAVDALTGVEIPVKDDVLKLPFEGMNYRMVEVFSISP